MRKKKAIELVGSETNKEAIVDLLLKNEFTNEEAFEFVNDLEAVPAKPSNTATAKTVSLSPNATLDLSGFNYKEMKGADFRRYVELVGDRNYQYFDQDEGKMIAPVARLRQDDQYDFELYRVEVYRKPRFPGIENSPMDFNGLRIKDDTPIHTTRITVAQAIEFNAQILNQHGIAGHGKYYFLKKVI